MNGLQKHLQKINIVYIILRVIMKRVLLKTPKLRKIKGVWKKKKIGEGLHFIPACLCSKKLKKYCKPTTRKFLLWEAKIMLEKIVKRKIKNDIN